MTQRRVFGYGKAGLSGLFLLGLAAFADAEPLRIQIESASAGVDQRTHEPIVTVKLSKQSQQALGAYTQHNVGKPMELRVDGKVIMKSVIREPLLAGTFQTSGNFTADEVSNLARQLAAGATIVLELVD
jgi:preprotein translocase subunit SecD